MHLDLLNPEAIKAFLMVFYTFGPLFLGLILLRVFITKGPRFIVFIIKSIIDGFGTDRRHWNDLEDLEKSYGGFTMRKIDKMSGADFELFIEKLFTRLDHDKIIKIDTPGGTGDQGCDLIVRYKSGVILGIQCKRHSGKVDNKAVQNIVTAKAIYKLTSLMVITNNYFTPGAMEAAKANKVIMYNRDTLIKLLKLYKKTQPVNIKSNLNV